MKLFHLSDLHLGKRLNEFSLLEDQQYILNQIVDMALDERPDGVLIAGDIYDKAVPSTEAVQLFDDFLVRLAKQNISVFAVSGNHDSPERIAFGSRLIDPSGVHLSPVYDGQTHCLSLTDSYGPVHIYLLPFLKPLHVRRFFPERELASYTDALQAAVDALEVDQTQRNLLVAHQFVSGSSLGGSEDFSVGGVDSVDVSVFAPFDYVALGHIHRAQQAGRSNVRYCGTPLSYSFSEAGQEKSVTMVELEEKGSLSIRTLPLIPKRGMREIRGAYEELTLQRFYQDSTYQEDYLHITLTDEEDIPDAVGKLRVIYHNLMKLDYDNRRTRSATEILGAEQVEQKTPLELFEEFYEKQNNQPLTEQQRLFTAGLVESIWERALCGQSN